MLSNTGSGRRVDDLQYLGGRRLLLQRLARLGQKPRVFHSDDRLRGEVLHERDLLVGERLGFPTIGADGAEQRAVLVQWHHQQRANGPAVHGGLECRKLAVGLGLTDIGKVNEPFTARQLLQRSIAVGAQRKRICGKVRYAVGRDPAILLAIENPQIAKRRFSDMHSLFEQRVEHWRKVAGRRIDDLQYLSGCGLLLQGLAGLGQKPRVFHRNDRLRREIF